MKPNPKYLKKTGTYFCFILSILVSPGIPAWSLPGGAGLEIKGDLVSADLQDASILDVLNKLKTSRGIWYKSEPSLLGERISAYFKNLPLEKGLRRILSSQDYCLHFDSSGKLVGITLMKKDLKEVQRGMAYRPSEPPRPMMPPSMPPIPQTNPNGPLYIPPKPATPVRPPIVKGPMPTKIPMPNRNIRNPNSNPSETVNPFPDEESVNRPAVRPGPPVVPPGRPPIPIFPEPPDDDEFEEEEEE